MPPRVFLVRFKPKKKSAATKRPAAAEAVGKSVQKEAKRKRRTKVPVKKRPAASKKLAKPAMEPRAEAEATIPTAKRVPIKFSSAQVEQSRVRHSSSQAEPLPADPPNLVDFAQRLKMRLTPKEQKDLLRTLRWLRKVGTQCSGSDSPVLAIEALYESYTAGAALEMFEHTFSCEKKEWKRDFVLKTMNRVKNVYAEVSEMPYERAFCWKAKGPVEVDTVQLNIAGFPCTDVSGRNAKANEHRDIIQEAGGSTGAVFWDILEFLVRKDVPLVLLENVLGLLGKSSKGAVSNFQASARGKIPGSGWGDYF
jgi:C-5 cytosine-specific DNA methylase